MDAAILPPTPSPFTLALLLDEEFLDELEGSFVGLLPPGSLLLFELDEQSASLDDLLKVLLLGLPLEGLSSSKLVLLEDLLFLLGVILLGVSLDLLDLEEGTESSLVFAELLLVFSLFFAGLSLLFWLLAQEWQKQGNSRGAGIVSQHLLVYMFLGNTVYHIKYFTVKKVELYLTH